MLRRNLDNILQFLKKDIWLSSFKEHSVIFAFFIRQLKTTLLAARTFDQKHSRLQAASMTYYFTLTLVPSLTLIYGLMQGFGLEDTFKVQLYQSLPSHKELIDAVFNMAQSYVLRTHGSLFAGIGLALMFWSIFQTLITMEEAFNDIWGIKESKSILRKLSDYLTVFLICPFLIIFSGSATVFISTQVHHISTNLFSLGPLAPLIYMLLFFVPFLVICMVFTFVYIFMPNTKVNFIAGLSGGFVAGALYQVTQWLYIIFQVWLNHANAMYGSLAAIPLFLGWLQLSWMIVLFGAEFSFATQNFKTYEFEPESFKPSPYLRKLIGILIMHVCVKNFEQGKQACTAQKLSEHLYLPARLTQEVINNLTDAGVLSKLHIDHQKFFAYQPARTTSDITVKYVLDAMDHLGQEDIHLKNTPEMVAVTRYLETFNQKIAAASEHVLLKDL